MRQYNKDLSRSVKMFNRHVEPLIRKEWQVEFIHACEGKEDGLDGALDHRHSIDYLLFKGGRMHGLANRILFKKKSANKITLRKKRINRETKEETPSDYLKLKKAIEEKDAYPEYFCVACVVDDVLVSCVTVQTVDLIKFIDETNPPIYKNIDEDKNQIQEYYCFDWRDMKKSGYKVWKLQPEAA